MKKITVNPTWCKRCGICADSCPQKVFDWEKDQLPQPTRTEQCTTCKICEIKCPDFAIQVEVKV